VSIKKKLLIFLYLTARSFVPTFLDKDESGSWRRDWVVTPRVLAASSCGMHQTLAKCSALTPFDLPAETACIVANAVAKTTDTLVSNISQASSSFETLPNAIAAWDTQAFSVAFVAKQ
jgi:hypothetical protein